jgi:hypothetical protein
MRWFLILVAVAAVGFPGGAAASWRPPGSGSAAAKAKTLGSGNVPNASVSGHKVTVTWASSSYTNGGTPGGYVIKRYDATTGVVQTIGANCSGTIAGLTCTESGVPFGSWKYSVTPATAGWRGAESAKSATVTV